MVLPKIVRNSGLYSVVSFLQKGVGFFLLPVYTAYLSTEDYGTLSVIQSLVSFLSIFLLLSLDGSAARFHFLSSGKYYRMRVWGTTLMLVIYNSICLGGILIIGHRWIIEPFAKDIPFFPLIFLSLLATILSPLYLFFQRWLQVTQQGGRYVVNMFLNFIVLTGLNVTSLVVFNLGIYGLIWSTLLTSIIFFIYSLIVFVPHVHLKVNKHIAVKSFKYALPLLPHTISSWFMSMVDRLLINSFLGAAKTGLYSVAYQFGNIIGIISSSVNQAFSPWFMQKIQENRQQLSEVYKFAEIAIVGYCFLALGITFFSPEVIRIMTPLSYHTAWEPILFICFGYVFGGLYFFLGMPLWLRKTKFVFIITLVSAIISVGLNYLLIPLYGIIGSGISLCFSLGVSSVLALYLSLRAEPDIVFPWRRMYCIILLFLVVGGTIFFLEGIDSLVLKIIAKLGVIVLLFVFTLFYYREQLNIFLKVIINKKNE